MFEIERYSKSSWDRESPFVLVLIQVTSQEKTFYDRIPLMINDLRNNFKREITPRHNSKRACNPVMAKIENISNNVKKTYEEM